eukprot:11190258-Lingulodinium_polyedra.AAC.1
MFATLRAIWAPLFGVGGVVPRLAPPVRSGGVSRQVILGFGRCEGPKQRQVLQRFSIAAAEGRAFSPSILEEI